MSQLRLVYLLFGSLLSVLFLLKALSGKKHEYLAENLEGDEYPLKGIYSVGFSWNDSSLFSLKGKVREKLVGQAKLLFDPKFAEYYATLSWAQMLSFVHLSLAAGFILAGVLDSGLMAIIGAAVAGVFGFYFINHMNDRLSTREKDCTAELPEIVSTMALLINAGMMLRDAWRTIAESKEGTIYKLMLDSCVDMENGMSEIDAIHKFGRLSSSQEVRKFAGALAQSIERGGSELADFLSRQSIEMWNLKKQLMLQKGEAAASKLLMPTVMLFVAIIIAVFTGAVGMLI